MDDNKPTGGWVPAARSVTGRGASWPPASGSGPDPGFEADENLFTPRVSPNTGNGASAFEARGPGADREDRPSGASSDQRTPFSLPDMPFQPGMPPQSLPGPLRPTLHHPASIQAAALRTGPVSGSPPFGPGSPRSGSPRSGSESGSGSSQSGSGSSQFGSGSSRSGSGSGSPRSGSASPWSRSGASPSAPSISARVRSLRRLTRPSNWHGPARRGGGPVRDVRLLLARYRRPLAIGLALAGLWITIRSAAPPPPATIPMLTAAHDLPAGHTLTNDDLRTGAWPADRVPLGRLSLAAGRVLASPIRAGEPVTDARVLGPGLLTGQPAGMVAVPIRLGDAAAGLIVRPGDRVDVLASSAASTLGSAWSTDPDPTIPDSAESGSGGAGSGEAIGGRSTSSAQADSGPDRVATAALVLAAPGPAADDGWSGSTGTGLGASGLGASGLGGLTGGASAGGAGVTTAGLLVLAVASSEAGDLVAAQSGQYLAIAVRPRP
jgi:hypothetical protein